MIYAFAVDYANGCADFVLAQGTAVEEAHALVVVATEGRGVTGVMQIHLEDMLADQYNGVAFLSTESGNV